MTAFADIAGAFIAALQQDPPVSDHIIRAGARAVPEQASTAVNVSFDGSQPSPGAIMGAPVDWNTRIFVELYARSSTTSGDLAVDPLLAAVYARLAADSTLGGAVDDIGTPAIEASFDAQGQKTGWVRLIYTVLHRTTAATL